MARNKRGRDARDRGLRRRGSRERGSLEHSTTVCPECRVHIPTLEGFNELPYECPGCGATLRCRACGGNLVEAERESGDEEEVPLERGECPRCEEPVSGEETGPESEDFTWSDR